jgi:hypothetical protein
MRQATSAGTEVQRADKGILTMKSLLAWLLILLCSFAIAAQEQDKPLPDRWHGLIIDQSTPDDAIKLLGQPKKDRDGGLRTYPLNQRLTLDHNSKGFRKLYYEKLPGVEHAEIVFKDNKLVALEIHPEKSIPAGNVPNLYGLEFTPKIGKGDQLLSPKDYESNRGNVYPKNYPVAYNLVAQTEKTFISAFVSNVGMGSILLGSRRGKTGADDLGGFPGKVEFIQIISRTLENRTGADVLK